MHQKVKGLNKKFAAVAPIDQQSDTWISAIVQGLRLAEQNGEYEEGFVYWLKELNNYISMFELHFSKETHLHLVHLVYRHLTDLSQDSLVHSACMDAFSKLLKNKKVLTPDDLQLAWRPLYLLGRKYKNFASTVIRHGNEFIKVTWRQYQRCLTHASPYFAPDATREILAELTPRLCVTSADFESNLQYLALLPTCLPKAASPGDSVDLWVGHLMQFWTERAIGTKTEGLLVMTLAPLAETWRGHVDWEPRLADLCTLLHRCLRLPVGKAPKSAQPPRVVSASSACGSSAHAGASGKASEDRLIGALAGVLVASVKPGSAAVQHLRRLMRLLEPYTHPSNSGRWLTSIAVLFRKLLNRLTHRLANERHGYSNKTWWRLPSDATNITEEQREELFSILLEPMFTLIHGKGHMLTLASCAHLLCQFNPTAFLARLFADLQPAVLDASQPQRTCALLLVAARVGFVIVRHAPEEVAPLLYSILPLLEQSNPLRFSAAVALVQELTHEISLDTQLEEFAAQFIDRILAIVDSLLQGPGVGSATSALGLVPQLEIFYHMVMRGSEEVRNILVNRLLAWSAGAAYEPSQGPTQAVLRLFASFSGSVPQIVLPWCIRQATASVESEGGLDLTKEERVSSKLLWDVAVLESAISNADTVADSSMLNGRDQLAWILRCCLRSRDRRLSTITQRLFVELTSGGLTMEVYPTLDLAAYQALSWGERRRLKDLRVIWHTPRPEEKEFVQWMAQEFLWPEVQLVTRHLDGVETLDKQV